MKVGVVLDTKDNFIVSYLESKLHSCKISILDEKSNLSEYWSIFYSGRIDQSNTYKIIADKLSSVSSIKIALNIYFDENNIDLSLFDIFDHVFLNDLNFISILRARLGTEYVHYFPTNFSNINLQFSISGDNVISYNIKFFNQEYIDLLPLANILCWITKRKKPIYCNEFQIVSLLKNYSERNDIKENYALRISNMLSFLITGDFHSIARNDAVSYISGGHKIENIVGTVVRDHVKSNIGINMNFFKKIRIQTQDLWTWDNIISLFKVYDDEKGLLFDDFLERSFGELVDEYNEIGIIPYTVPWIGLIRNSLPYKILQSERFILSLLTCESIICTSEYERKKIERYVSDLGLNLKIWNILIPIERFNDRFTPKIYYESPRIIQRSSKSGSNFEIFTIPVPGVFKFLIIDNPCIPTRISVDKNDLDNLVVITNPSESGTKIWINELCNYVKENFYDSEEFKENFKIDIIFSEAGKWTVSSENIKLKLICEKIRELLQSVIFINSLSKEQYNKAIERSVFFIPSNYDSVEISLLECMSKTTPILLKNKPVVSEYLGEKYPLFYKNINDIKVILTPFYINLTTVYLLKRRELLSLEIFFQKIRHILNSSQKYKS